MEMQDIYANLHVNFFSFKWNVSIVIVSFYVEGRDQTIDLLITPL
jgi:hypothetical protein